MPHAAQHAPRRVDKASVTTLCTVHCLTKRLEAALCRSRQKKKINHVGHKGFNFFFFIQHFSFKYFFAHKQNSWCFHSFSTFNLQHRAQIKKKMEKIIHLFMYFMEKTHNVFFSSLIPFFKPVSFIEKILTTKNLISTKLHMGHFFIYYYYTFVKFYQIHKN